MVRDGTWRNICFALILTAAIVLRFFRLSDIPPGVNRDEASVGYTAYSILKTGKDEYGRRFPLSFQSFGDWKLPLYIYLTVPSVAIFGLNEFAVRFPSALAGTLTVFLTYFLVLELFSPQAPSTKHQTPNKFKIQNSKFKKDSDVSDIGASDSEFIWNLEFGIWDLQKLALLSAFLLAISPWHIHLSRVESESNVAVFFTTLATLLLLKSYRGKPRLLIPSFVLIGLTYFTYHGNHIFTTLLLISVIVLYRKKLLENRYLKVSTVLFAVLTGIILSQTFATADRTKLSGIGIFGNPTVVHEEIEKPRNVHTQPQAFIARIIHNRVIFAFETVARNYIRSFSPEFLFIRGGTNRAHNIENFGNMYLVEAPFLLFGIFVLLRLRRNAWAKLILLWIAVAPVASSITKDAPHSNRMFAIYPMLSIVIALGIITLISQLKYGKFVRTIIIGGLAAIFAVNIALYLDRYFIHFPKNEAEFWGLGYKRLARFLAEPPYNEKRTVISHPEYSPYIFLLFYQLVDPMFYQTTAERYSPTVDAFVHVGSFGRFEFRPIDWSNDLNKDMVLVEFSDEIPLNIASELAVHDVVLPDGEPQFSIVASFSR